MFSFEYFEQLIKNLNSIEVNFDTIVIDKLHKINDNKIYEFENYNYNLDDPTFSKILNLLYIYGHKNIVKTLKPNFKYGD